MYKLSVVLLSLFIATACTKGNTPVVNSEFGTYSSALSGSVGIDSFGWSFVAIGHSAVNAESTTISTQGTNRILVAMATMINSNITETITDTAGLTWTQVGTWTQSEQDVNEGFIMSTMWY